MRITDRDRLNLARFGCTFLARPKLIGIGADRSWKKQISSAGIIARLIYKQCASGPLLCLAFEISPTKALPHYCFFPFNLRTKAHRDYLIGISKKGKIHLCFLADSRQILRTHDVLPPQCARMMEVCASALAELEKFPAKRYDFIRAVTELEKNTRLADYFDYVIPDTELQRLIDSSKADAQNVSSEDRARAAKIANELLGVFRSRYEGFVREWVNKLPTYRRGFGFLTDLHRRFQGDYAGFAQFVADTIAAHSPKEDNRQLETLITPLLESILRLIERMSQTSVESDAASRAQFEADLRNFVNCLADGKGVSTGALQNILSSFGLRLGGQPGRPTEDYSNEYALKAKGLSWPAVTEHRLENDPDTCREFGGRKYDELTLEDRERLENRTRQGVRSYAERTGEPWPLPQGSKVVPPSDEGQKNSS